MFVIPFYDCLSNKPPSWNKQWKKSARYSSTFFCVDALLHKSLLLAQSSLLSHPSSGLSIFPPGSPSSESSSIFAIAITHTPSASSNNFTSANNHACEPLTFHLIKVSEPPHSHSSLVHLYSTRVVIFGSAHLLCWFQWQIQDQASINT